VKSTEGITNVGFPILRIPGVRQIADFGHLRQWVESSSSSAKGAIIDIDQRLTGGLPPDCRPTAIDLATAALADKHSVF
jgi:hypothetical protein